MVGRLIMPTCKAQIFLFYDGLSQRFPSPTLYNHHHHLSSFLRSPKKAGSTTNIKEEEGELKRPIRILSTQATRSAHSPDPDQPTHPSSMTTGEGAEAAAVPRVVSILSALLQRVAERNDAAAAAPPPAAAAAAGPPVLSAFQGLTKPAISIGGYLERIFRFAGCSPSCYVVAYIYLDRFVRRRPALAVDSFNVHRLLITSVLTAVKFVDDMCVL